LRAGAFFAAAFFAGAAFFAAGTCASWVVAPTSVGARSRGLSVTTALRTILATTGRDVNEIRE
jgi:hypothetical protein